VLHCCCCTQVQGCGQLAATCKACLDAATVQHWQWQYIDTTAAVCCVTWLVSCYATTHQVWYSATWSRRALASFRSAVDTVLQRPVTSSTLLPPATASTASSSSNMQQPLNEGVAQLLRHWQLHDVTLKQARQGWLKESRTPWVTIANYKKKADRQALCAYSIRYLQHMHSPHSSSSRICVGTAKRMSCTHQQCSSNRA
jgi:hypothetical protein